MKEKYRKRKNVTRDKHIDERLDKKRIKMRRMCDAESD